MFVLQIYLFIMLILISILLCMYIHYAIRKIKKGKDLKINLFLENFFFLILFSIGYGFIILYTPIKIEEDIVYIEKIPDYEEYCKINSNNNTIEYLDGKELISVQVRDYQVSFDTEKPYIKMNKQKNIFDNTILVDAKVHLKNIK